MNEKEYAGFWVRTGAALIDTILILAITMPLLLMIYGKNYLINGKMINGFWDFIIQWVLPAIIAISFWMYKSATPGKMATKLTIVDEKTGEKPSTEQFIIRYFGYFISMIPLFIGIIWVGVDEKKQGWHDKIAGTVVIKSNKKTEVIFE